MKHPQAGLRPVLLLLSATAQEGTEVFNKTSLPENDLCAFFLVTPVPRLICGYDGHKDTAF